MTELMDSEDGWTDETNPLGCCVYYKTEGGVYTHGGPDCIWPGVKAVRAWAAPLVDGIGQDRLEAYRHEYRAGEEMPVRDCK